MMNNVFQLVCMLGINEDSPLLAWLTARQSWSIILLDPFPLFIFCNILMLTKFFSLQGWRGGARCGKLVSFPDSLLPLVSSFVSSSGVTLPSMAGQSLLLIKYNVILQLTNAVLPKHQAFKASLIFYCSWLQEVTLQKKFKSKESSKVQSTLGCPKKTKSPNFVSQLNPLVFIG